MSPQAGHPQNLPRGTCPGRRRACPGAGLKGVRQLPVPPAGRSRGAGLVTGEPRADSLPAPGTQGPKGAGLAHRPWAIGIDSGPFCFEHFPDSCVGKVGSHCHLRSVAPWQPLPQGQRGTSSGSRAPRKLEVWVVFSAPALPWLGSRGHPLRGCWHAHPHSPCGRPAASPRGSLLCLWLGLGGRTRSCVTGPCRWACAAQGPTVLTFRSFLSFAVPTCPLVVRGGCRARVNRLRSPDPGCEQGGREQVKVGGLASPPLALLPHLYVPQRGAGLFAVSHRWRPREARGCASCFEWPVIHLQDLSVPSTPGRLITPARAATGGNAVASHAGALARRSRLPGRSQWSKWGASSRECTVCECVCVSVC